MKLDLERPIQTVNGNEVRILTTKGADKEYPMVGEVELTEDDWVVSKWKTDGTSISGDTLNITNPIESLKAIVVLLRSPIGTVFSLGAFETKIESVRYVLAHFPGSKIIGNSTVKITEGEFTEYEGNSNV